MLMFCRVGYGYDIHRFLPIDDIKNKEIRLCGINIPHHRKIEAHSDGDVPIDALVNAILGSCALGDIGGYFPPSDDKWKDIESTYFLKFANNLLYKAGYFVGNVDITIVTENPKIAPYAQSMCNKLASILSIQSNYICVKGKTNEQLDSIGSGNAICAHAIVMAVPLKWKDL